MKRPLKSVFTRLLFYFLLVMAIPFIIFFLFSSYNADRNFIHALTSQVESHVNIDATVVENLMEEYRHKAYVLSQRQEVKDAVRYGRTGEGFYSSLFKTMEGTLDYASAHIISLDGQFKASTHTFPMRYDFRLHSSILEDGSLINRTAELENPTNSVISVTEHRADENNKNIFFSVARQILNEAGAPLGYVIIDVYTDCIEGRINTTGLLSEELLVSQDDYTACSMLNPTMYGSYEKFPILKDEKSIQASRQILDGQFAIIGITDSRSYQANISQWMDYFTISIIIGLAISVILSLIFSHSISKRMTRIGEKMQEIEDGNFNTKLSPTGLKEIDTLADCFNVMVVKMNELIDKTREEEAKLGEAERKQLESQLNPHFLFNTLNTIKALARINGEKDIYIISVKLGKLLRSSLSSHVSEVSIRDSLELTESYLTIQRIRFKDKIDYSIEADEEALDVMTPKLIIQPFADNAIVHGLEPMTGQGRVDIRVRKLKGAVEISIEDNGIGFEVDPANLDRFRNSTHVGIWNTYRRLQMYYGDSLEFDIQSSPGDGTRITMVLPEKKEGKKR